MVKKPLSIIFIIFIILLVLKVLNMIVVSWWWVFCPLWIGPAFIILFLSLVILLFIVLGIFAEIVS